MTTPLGDKAAYAYDGAGGIDEPLALVKNKGIYYYHAGGLALSGKGKKAPEVLELSGAERLALQAPGLVMPEAVILSRCSRNLSELWGNNISSALLS